MSGFDAKFLDELKSKNDIVDVASKYVQLEQRGPNFWGRCPFHHEKTASFCVNLSGQFYYCFGCHKSGDVLTLVQELESLDFNDAVKFLAERVHMPLPQIKYDDEQVKAQRKKKERLLALMKDTARFYLNNLYSGACPEHVEYVKKRGLTKETMQTYGIGASKDFSGLVKHLEERGYTKEEMLESGTVSKSEKNGKTNYFDALAGRLIIPHIDQFGSVIAFCGRIVEKRDDVGKYVNTRETYLFSKGKTLFNLNNLKRIKNEQGINSVIIVEGHMDVISLTQAGFLNVVASMGTALTKDQARIIKRYAETVYISYDGDFAGRKAAIRGLEILKEEGLEVKVVSLPDGKDPDDVVKEGGKQAYQDCLDRAMPLIDFKLEVVGKTYDVNTVDGKRKYVTQAIRVIKESESPAEQEDLLKRVRDVTGFTYESLKRELYNLPEKSENKGTNIPEYNETSQEKGLVASRFIIASYFMDKPYAKETDIREISFDGSLYNRIKEYLIEKEESKSRPIFSDIFDIVSEEEREEVSKIAELVSSGKATFDQAKYFYDCIRTLKAEILEKEINRLIALCKSETNTEKRRQLTQELTVALSKKNKLSLS